MRRFRSSSTVPMLAMPKLSTRTFATLGERKPGSVGPRWMFLTPVSRHRFWKRIRIGKLHTQSFFDFERFPNPCNDCVAVEVGVGDRELSEQLFFVGAKPPTPLFASKYAATPNAGLRPATPRIRHDSDLS